MEANQMEKETSEAQNGVSIMDTTSNLPIRGDKKVLERKTPAEQRTWKYIHSVSALVVKRRIDLSILEIVSFRKGSLEDIAVSTYSEQSNIREENKL